MNKLSSYWVLEGDLPEFPTLKALKQEFLSIIEGIEPKMTSGLFYAFHVINGKNHSCVIILINSNGKASFSRPIKI